MLDQISVPDPCGENWNGMPKQDNGRYCSSCRKVVIDFTGKSNEEILQYIRERSGTKVCGTFRSNQLAPPDNLVRFLAAILLVFGMSLFSCQSVDLGDKPKAEEPVELPYTTTGVMVVPPDPPEPVKGSIVCNKNGPLLVVDVLTPCDTITGDIQLPPEKGTLKASRKKK